MPKMRWRPAAGAPDPAEGAYDPLSHLPRRLDSRAFGAQLLCSLV